MALEGIVSKRADAPYTPGNRGLWLKVKCLHREEFVVIGWTDPEGARPFLGALLLGYLRSRRPSALCRPRRLRHQPDGARAAMAQAAAACDRQDATRSAAAPGQPFRIAAHVEPCPLGAARARCRASISPGPGDNLLRQVVYEGLREDKPAAEVRRERRRPRG